MKEQTGPTGLAFVLLAVGVVVTLLIVAVMMAAAQ